MSESTQLRAFSREQVPVRLPMLGVLCCFLLTAPLFWLLQRKYLAGGWQQDLLIYNRALQEWLAGQNPYNANHSPMFFLYPPIFLHTARFLAQFFSGHWGLWLYSAVSIAAICALPIVLAKYLFRMEWFSPLFALFLFLASPRFAGAAALCGMNIAGILYFAAFAGAVPGVRHNRWRWFYLAVCCGASIKITFLGMLLLPLLLSRRQWLKCVLCGAAVAAANLAEMAAWPEMYAGYRWSVAQGLRQNYGCGLFGILATYHRRLRTDVGVLPCAAFLLLAAGLIVSLLLLRRRMEADGLPTTGAGANGNWMALVVVAVILMNPREMQYDMDVALFAAFVLWVHALRTQRLLTLAAVLFLPSLVETRLVLNEHLHGMFETLLVLAAVVLAYRRMWLESAPEPVRKTVLEKPAYAGRSRKVAQPVGV